MTTILPTHHCNGTRIISLSFRAFQRDSTGNVQPVFEVAQTRPDICANWALAATNKICLQSMGYHSISSNHVLCTVLQKQGGLRASNRCGKCKQVFYCNVACQRAHFKHHKNDCVRPWCFLIDKIIFSRLTPCQKLRAYIIVYSDEVWWFSAGRSTSFAKFTKWSWVCTLTNNSRFSQICMLHVTPWRQ